MREGAFGRLPARVSAIGLGTAQLANLDGTVAGIKRLDPADARRLLEAAIDDGVSFLDTGDQYGAAEELIGSLDADRRGKVLVATKAGLRDDGARDFSPEYLRSRLNRSLRRLNSTRVDLFQLNKPAAKDWQDGRLAAFLAEEKAKGCIRFAGVVVGEPADGLRALDEPVLDAAQVLFHLTYHASEIVIGKAARLGKGVIVRSPLNSGLLSGAYRPDTVVPATDERSRYFKGPEFSARVAALHLIQKDLGVPNEKLVEFALRFASSEPGISTVIPGASSLAQARRYAACGDAEPFSVAELARIKGFVVARMTGVGGSFQLR